MICELTQRYVANERAGLGTLVMPLFLLTREGVRPDPGPAQPTGQLDAL
jgi:hypothetical protein